MNDKYNQNDAEKTDGESIDVISFDRRKRAEQIRMNEEAEREKRRIEQMKRRKAERIRRAQIQRMKTLAVLSVGAIAVVCAVIFGIVSIVKNIIAGSEDKQTQTPTNKVSAEETKKITAFAESDSIIYSPDGADFLETADSFVKSVALSSAQIPSSTKKISEFGALSEQIIYASDDAVYAEFRETVKNAPIFSNGYVWSENDSMKSTVTGGYMYDTNTSYITAVANICLYEGSTAFLNEIDTDSQPQRDKSQGKTVGEKLNMALSYLFDGNIADGGIKFDTISSLCYIHTSDNNGTSSGYSSNRWFNFRFGYLDAYSNIVFNRAMVKVSQMYTLGGLAEDADRYSAVAQANAEAFSEKFWDSEKMRFVGCFDKDGTVHDYGFVFVNLEAIEADMASAEQAQKIFEWLDGSRTIAGDASQGADIYKFGFAPRNTTVSAEDKWWDYLGGNLPLSTAAAYGNYYQNGGTSLSTAYYDISARYASGDISGAKARINALLDEYKASGFVQTDSTACEISESALGRLAPTAIIKTAFGVNIDGLHVTVSPDASIIGAASSYGIKKVKFAQNSYNFLYDSGKLYITADNFTAVRIRAGGLEPNTQYSVIKVQNGEMLPNPETVTSGADGIAEITTDFGSEVYLKIEKSK